jgi:hypothetical protein
MSWEIFKQNILRMSNNPNGIPDIDTVARTYAREYDAAVKRGFDIQNNISVKRGNVELMEQLFKLALQKGLNSATPYDLVGEMGKGVIAYWQGAVLNEFPIPLIPAPGSTVNIGVSGNIVTNPGVWAPVVVLPTTQLPKEFKIDQKTLEVKQAEVKQAEISYKDKDSPKIARNAAKEYVKLIKSEISSKSYNSIPTPITDTKSIDAVVDDKIQNTNSDKICEIGLKVVNIAKADVGILETGTRSRNGDGLNYGGSKNPNGELPVGVYGRIDEMMKNAGLDNPSEVKRKGSGYYWCAGAVTTWWKEAGLQTPPGAASCANWGKWARSKGYFSKTPKIGAAVLYGESQGAENHIGVVLSISNNGGITTIEGNTSGGGFSRNGCGCFIKTPNMNKIIGYVIPPPCL